MGRDRWCREANAPKGRIPARIVADYTDTGKRRSVSRSRRCTAGGGRSIPMGGGILAVAEFVAEFD